MPVKTQGRTKASGTAKVIGKVRPGGRRTRNVRQVDPNKSAVPFHVTAFAASIFQPPAISDAVEEEPLFDRTKAVRVGKSKKK